jgi:hypothetical protein
MSDKRSSSSKASRISVAAGLTLPPSRFSRYFMGRKAGNHSRILFTGAIEHTLRTLLHDMKVVMQTKKRTLATPETVRLSVEANPDLAWSLGPCFISQSGWPKTQYFGVGKMRGAKKKTVAA